MNTIEIKDKKHIALLVIVLMTITVLGSLAIHQKQVNAATYGSVWIDTKGNAMTLDEKMRWNFTVVDDTISLTKYTGSITGGKIVGNMPATLGGKPVTSLDKTFQDKTSLIEAPALPNTVKTMDRTFYGCKSLTKAPTIPGSVSSLYETFRLTKLEQAPEIPNSVKEMYGTFSNTISLTEVPDIPNSVTNMERTFYSTGITEAPVIPDSVTNLKYTFAYTRLTKAPEIPNSITDMTGTFYYCTDLTQVSIIPNSITDMEETFYSCYSLINPPAIPNSVINMKRTFWDCTGLETAPIFPTSGVDLFETFRGCKSLSGDVYLPNNVKNISGIFYNTLKTINVHYYLGTASVEDYIKVSPNNVKWFTIQEQTPSLTVDVNDKDMTEEDLKAWEWEEIEGGIDLTNYIGQYNSDGSIKTPAPKIIDGKDVIAMTSTFESNYSVKIAPKLPPKLINMYSTFYDAKNLENAPEIPNSVVSMQYAFGFCEKLTVAPKLPDNLINLYFTFGYNNISEMPDIPDTVEDMDLTFASCKSLVDLKDIPDSVETMELTFRECESILETPKLPNKIRELKETFRYCYSLVKINELPDSIESLSRTFRDCTSLEDFPEKFPDSLENLSYCFAGCINLTGEFNVPDNIWGALGIFDGTKKDIVGWYTKNNTYIKTVSVPTNVEWKLSDEFIDDEWIDTEGNVMTLEDKKKWDVRKEKNDNEPVIYGYKGKIVSGKVDGFLPAIVAGDPIIKLYGTFENNLDLVETPRLPETVWYLFWTFKGCENLTKITHLPRDLAAADSTFAFCKSLTTVPDFPNNDAFPMFFGTGRYSLWYTFEGCESLVEPPKIEQGAWRMDYTFEGCTSLKTMLELPSEAGSWKTMFIKGVYENCTSLVNTKPIPEYVFLVADNFKGCISLKELPNFPRKGDVSHEYDTSNWNFKNNNSLEDARNFPSDLGALVGTFQNNTKLKKWINIGNAELRDNDYIEGSVFKGTVNPIVVWRNIDSDKYDLDDEPENIHIYPNYEYKDVNGNIMSMDDKSQWLRTETSEGFILDQYIGEIVNGKIVGEIPSTINNKPIIGFSKGLFNYDDNIKKLTHTPKLPENITDIRYLYSGGENITSIHPLNDNITNIKETFKDNKSLKIFPNMPTKLEVMDNAFNGCTSLVGEFYVPLDIKTANGIFDNTSKHIIGWYVIDNKHISNTLIPNNAEWRMRTTPTPEPTPPPIPNPNPDPTPSPKPEGPREEVELPKEEPGIDVGEDEVLEKVWYDTDGKIMTEEEISKWEIQEYQTHIWIKDYLGEYRDGKIIGSMPDKLQYRSFVKPTNEETTSPIEYKILEEKRVKDISGAFINKQELTTTPVFPKETENMSFTFSHCSNLASIVQMPEKVKILYKTFEDCTSLETTPTLPNTVIDMESTFARNIKLNKVTNLPNSVKTYLYTFEDCTSLVSVPDVPNGVEHLTGTFYNNTSLQRAPKLPNTLITMTGTFFNNTLLKIAPDIPNSVKGMYATFFGASLMDFPKLYNNIEDMQFTFENCKSLGGKMIVPQYITKLRGTFDGTVKPITITYSSKIEQVIKNTWMPSNITLVETNSLVNASQLSLATNAQTQPSSTLQKEVTVVEEVRDTKQSPTYLKNKNENTEVSKPSSFEDLTIDIDVPISITTEKNSTVINNTQFPVDIEFYGLKSGSKGTSEVKKNTIGLEIGTKQTYSLAEVGTPVNALDSYKINGRQNVNIKTITKDSSNSILNYLTHFKVALPRV